MYAHFGIRCTRQYEDTRTVFEGIHLQLIYVYTRSECLPLVHPAQKQLSEVHIPVVPGTWSLVPGIHNIRLLIVRYKEVMMRVLE